LIFDDLREIQRQHGYLPAEQLDALARRTNLSLPHIHGVADFFPHFHLAPPPRVSVQVCADMSCHLRGSDDVRRELSRRFNMMSDRDIAITEVSCLGQCDGAPAVRINDHSFRNVSAPLPHFSETLIDDGYFDMSKVMQALVDVDFEGIVIPDHVPNLGPPGQQGRGGGGQGAGNPPQYRPNPGLAYLLGSMHAMLKSAQNHKGKA